MSEFFATIDTAIMGRKTFDVVQRWVAAALGGSTKHYVFSRSQPPGERQGVTFVNESPVSFIAALRKQRGKNIWHMGGGELARPFLEYDLIDELYLGVVPILLGEGLPLFPSGFPQRNFSLIENKTFSQGLIALKYVRNRTKPKRKSS